MANITPNIAKGRVVEFYRLIKQNILPNSAFVVIPLQTSGLVTDAVLKGYETVSAVLAGGTLEQTTLGRKILTDVELAAFPSPDHANNKYVVATPLYTWAAATGEAVSKICIAFDADTTSGTDADLVPCAIFDYVFTPSGIDINIGAGTFFEARE